ncbi:superoxide dismutase domain protein, partial [Escherichia coli PA33]|jgi:tetratricopeptide (TPR) repeat protein
MRWS